MKRKIIQISSTDINFQDAVYIAVTALCDDGTVFVNHGMDEGWYQTAPIPQPDVRSEQMEIKKCPFSADEAKTKYQNGLWWLECTGEDCHLISFGPYATEEEVIEAWNIRKLNVRSGSDE